MRKWALSALAFSILVAVAACETQRMSAPQDGGSDGVLQVPSLPTSHANLSCSYTPSGDISIAVNTNQFFTPSNATDCAGAVGVLTPADGRVGFNAAPCTVTQTTANPSSWFKVRRCTTGPASLRIYTDFTKTTVLQTIGLDRIP